MYYKGPYRAINGDGWAIKGNAIFNNNKKGLFEISNSSLDPYTGYRSFLFPRSGRLSLNTNVNYLGSSDRFGDNIHRMAEVTGTTTTPDYVDGCNLRVMNYNVATTEGINSCNVNGSIEVFYMKDNVEVNITTDKSIKLQLIRASLTDYEGKEVLNSAFKRCDNSSTCGSSECCFNSRCWSKDIVSQCVDTTPIVGNEPVGAACATDYECSSLCCNSSSGTCSPHITTGAAPILCAKSAGQTCVSREFCAKTFVPTGKIVKKVLGNGTVTCEVRYTPVETYGSCVSGLCAPAPTPTPPVIDWTAANPCASAVDP